LCQFLFAAVGVGVAVLLAGLDTASLDVPLPPQAVKAMTISAEPQIHAERSHS